MPEITLNAGLFSMFGLGVILTLIAGIYCIIVTDNLIRALIGMEIMTKAVTLLIILVGNWTGKIALAQSLAITLIVIEVVVVATAVGIVLCIFRHEKSIDAKLLREIKG